MGSVLLADTVAGPVSIPRFPSLDHTKRNLGLEFREPQWQGLDTSRRYKEILFPSSNLYPPTPLQWDEKYRFGGCKD